MILCNAKFLTNHNLKGIYTRNFKASVYEFIYIKTMITFSDQGEDREKPSEAHNDLAQDSKHQKNIDGKTSLKSDKEFKKRLKKNRLQKTKQFPKRKIKWNLKHSVIHAKNFFKYAVSVTKT